MTLLSKTCVYAIRATVEIAAITSETGRQYVPIRRVASNLGLSFHFLAKITQILAEAGILTSFRGPNGGVGLARAAKDIHMIDIVNATDGIEIFDHCLLGLPDCDQNNPCHLHEAWDEIRARLLSELKKETAASVLKKRKPPTNKVSPSRK